MKARSQPAAGLFHTNTRQNKEEPILIVILKQNPNRDQLESLISWLQEKGVTIHTSIGEATPSWVWWATPPSWTST